MVVVFANLTVVGHAVLDANITTIGNQEYQQNISLFSNTTLQGSAGIFGGTLNGNSNDLILNFSDVTTIDGSKVFSNLGNLSSFGDVELGGLIVTSGTQAYSKNISLISNTTLQGSGGLVGGTLNGNSNDLTLNFSGDSLFLGGDGNGINNLTVVGPALLGASITTIGSQEYQQNISLSSNTTLQGSAGIFGGTLNGNSNDLTLNFSDITTIDGNSVFSNLGNLTSVGAVELNGTINTTGSQEYQNSVTLQGDTKLEGTSGTINGSLDGGNNSLSLDFSELTTINGSSGVTNLQNLISVGDVALGGLIVTSGTQAYENISLISNTTLQGSAGIFGGDI